MRNTRCTQSAITINSLGACSSAHLVGSLIRTIGYWSLAHNFTWRLILVIRYTTDVAIAKTHEKYAEVIEGKHRTTHFLVTFFITFASIFFFFCD